MTEYFIPSQQSESEFTEKRSRFIGRVSPASSEEEAREFIERIRKQHHDARHNCWCYILREPGVVRYSDDGEPQGTAGQPMLEVFQRESIVNVVCVSTRYFGGILLGTGGLVRAYTRSAKDALTAAGISVVRRWESMRIRCDYSRFETVRREVLSCDGVIEDTKYSADVTLSVLIPESTASRFCSRLVEVTAGAVHPEAAGEVFRAVPLPAAKK